MWHVCFYIVFKRLQRVRENFMGFYSRQQILIHTVIPQGIPMDQSRVTRDLCKERRKWGRGEGVQNMGTAKWRGSLIGNEQHVKTCHSDSIAKSVRACLKAFSGRQVEGKGSQDNVTPKKHKGIKMLNLENKSTKTSTGLEQQLCNKSSTERRANLKRKNNNNNITWLVRLRYRINFWT